MSQKVLAVLSYDPILRAISDRVAQKKKQFDGEMKMLESMMENKEKAFEEMMDKESKEIEDRLRVIGVLDCELHDHKHLIVAPEMDAVMLCDHTEYLKGRQP